LRHFETVKNIVDASEKDLQQVGNMGAVKARKIVKLLNAKYPGETEKAAPAADDSLPLVEEDAEGLAEETDPRD
jgi:ERCC4-type nuclease